MTKYLLEEKKGRRDEIKWKKVTAFVMWKIVLFVKKSLCLQSNIFDVSMYSMFVLKAKTP